MTRPGSQQRRGNQQCSVDVAGRLLKALTAPLWLAQGALLGVFQKLAGCVRCSGMGRGDPTNEQWARLEPLLPKGSKAGRPPTWSKRQLIDGIRWRTRTGAPA